MAEKKTLDYYMALPYQEVIVAAKEGGYVGYIPEPQDENEYSGRFNLRIPKSLHRMLALTAKREGVSLNQMAMFAIASGLNVSINTTIEG